MEEGIELVFECTGIRVEHPSFNYPQDHDPVWYESYRYSGEELIIDGAMYQYNYPKDSKITPYNLYEEIEDGVRVGWVRKDLGGNILEG